MRLKHSRAASSSPSRHVAFNFATRPSLLSAISRLQMNLLIFPEDTIGGMEPERLRPQPGRPPQTCRRRLIAKPAGRNLLAPQCRLHFKLERTSEEPADQ